MKKLTAIILVFAALFAFVGCMGYKMIEKPGLFFNSEKPIDGGELATLPPDGFNDGARQDDLLPGCVLGWDLIRTGETIPQGGAYKVYSSLEEFKKDYGDAGERGVIENLADGKAFVVRLGFTVNTGGYSFSVGKAGIKDGKVNIDVIRQAPSPDVMVTQAFVTHYLIVVFDGSEYREDLKIEVTVNGEPYTFASFGDEI